MATQNDAVQSISGPDPDLQSARLAAIAQSPDAQERNTPAEHPMVSYARGLLSPLNYQSQVPPGFDPRAAPADQRGAAPNLFTPGNPNESGNYAYNAPVVGGLGRIEDYLTQPGSPLRVDPEQQASPLNALGPVGELAGPATGAAEAIAGKLGQGVRELVGGRLPQFASEAGGQARVDLGALGGAPDVYRATILKDSTPAVVDTSGKVVQTAKTYKEAVAQAEARNAAPAAEDAAKAFAVSPEAQIEAALRNVPRDVGTVVRQAARAMPEMSAQTLVETPAVRSHLDLALARAKMPATDANVTSLADALLSQERARPTVGNRNAQAVREALGAVKPPTSVPPSAEQAAAEAGVTTPAQAQHGAGLQADVAAATPPAPPAGGPPSVTGAMPPDAPLPIGPRKATAQSLATEALHVLTDIPRSLMVIGHLPILRQGLPLMADAVVRGNPLEVPRALGRSFQAVVADPIRAQAITQGFRDTLEEAGLVAGRGGVHISDPLGPIAAREEFGLHSFLAKMPVVANLNRAYPTMLNSLRTGAATDLARMYRQSGRAVNSERIGHVVNISSGRGDIPAILDTPVARDALSGIFFGPRLTAASWQMATDTIGSLARVGEDVFSRRALDPVEVAQVRTTAAYVATGVGIMKLANSFGMNIGVDPTKTDFGRITLPDGKRLDLWGPFNENARLIAREIAAVQGNVQGKPAYGANTALDGLVSYVRSKLNAGAPTAVGDILAGSTQGGQSIPEAYGSPQGLQEHLLPLPFAVQEAKSGSSQGIGAQIAETALVSAGATVIDTPATVHYDGVGTPDTSGSFGSDPVLQEFMRMQKLDPNWKKQPDLQPPDTVIGSGRNAIKLDPTSAALYVQAVGEARRKGVSAVIYSPDYQKASLAQQEKLYDAAVSKADTEADQQFLAHGVIDSTDPKVIQSEAVAGFHTQSSNRDRAYWVALLDRAGKFTSDVAKAIEESQVTAPGQRTPITVEEYRKAAPLLHEYLAHAPFGTDTKPIGTEADWTAVAQAHVAANDRKNELQRSGVNPSLADAQAQRETLARMTSLVQRNLFLNGAQLENPARRQLALKYPTLRSFFPSDANTSRESDAAYQQFPFGR